MIAYQTGGRHFVTNLFKLEGSVFPTALLISVPGSLLTASFVFLLQTDRLGEHFKESDSIMTNNAIWGGFTFLVGFLVVFRTSQAYARFWEGATHMHKMGAEWFDACSSLTAFCKFSTCPPWKVLEFQNILIRLFSMLNAAALGEIQDSGAGLDVSQIEAFTMDLVDGAAIDDASLKAIRDSGSRVELIFQWIQQLVVHNIRTGVMSIPAPILSRSFQEIATGMIHFHDAMKLSNIPFPFPYAQTCDVLLFMHWFIVPFVVTQWVTNPWWAGVFSFIQIFTLWTLNLIACELENPFGRDPNDIDAAGMQLDMNEHLRMLCREQTRTLPHLKALGVPSSLTDGRGPSQTGAQDMTQLMHLTSLMTQEFHEDEVPAHAGASFCKIWEEMGTSPIQTRPTMFRHTTISVDSNAVRAPVGHSLSLKADAGTARAGRRVSIASGRGMSCDGEASTTSLGGPTFNYDSEHNRKTAEYEARKSRSVSLVSKQSSIGSSGGGSASVNSATETFRRGDTSDLVTLENGTSFQVLARSGTCDSFLSSASKWHTEDSDEDLEEEEDEFAPYQTKVVQTNMTMFDSPTQVMGNWEPMDTSPSGHFRRHTTPAFRLRSDVKEDATTELSRRQNRQSMPACSRGSDQDSDAVNNARQSNRELSPESTTPRAHKPVVLIL